MPSWRKFLLRNIQGTQIYPTNGLGLWASAESNPLGEMKNGWYFPPVIVISPIIMGLSLRVPAFCLVRGKPQNETHPLGVPEEKTNKTTFIGFRPGFPLGRPTLAPGFPGSASTKTSAQNYGAKKGIPNTRKLRVSKADWRIHISKSWASWINY